MSKSKPKTEADLPERKKAAPPSDRPSPTAGEIARIDRELIRLIQQRATLVLDAPTAPIRPPKKPWPRPWQANADRWPPTARALAAAMRCNAVVPRTAQRLPCARSKKQRIAFMGPMYSYSHLAAIHRFGQSVEFVPVATIAAVFEDVHRGHSDYGLVPVENSTDGRIADTLDMFTRVPVRICGEIDLQNPSFPLGQVPSKRRQGSLQQAASHFAVPQLAGQTLARRPHHRSHQHIHRRAIGGRKPGAAAIASIQAGVHYNLDVLAENIEDNPGNITRFAIIGDQRPIAHRQRPHRLAVPDRTSPRHPGRSDEHLQTLPAQSDLDRVLSRPRHVAVYLFFVEMEAHETDIRFRRAMAALKKKTLRLEILGSFPAATVVE